MKLRSFLHTLLLGVLTLCVGTMGPAALAAAPRSLTVNMQEEERGSGESAEIGSFGTSVLRPAKPSARADSLRRGARPCDSRDRLMVLAERQRSRTLCDLHVRIQV